MNPTVDPYAADARYAMERLRQAKRMGLMPGRISQGSDEGIKRQWAKVSAMLAQQANQAGYANPELYLQNRQRPRAGVPAQYIAPAQRMAMMRERMSQQLPDPSQADAVVQQRAGDFANQRLAYFKEALLPALRNLSGNAANDFMAVLSGAGTPQDIYGAATQWLAGAARAKGYSDPRVFLAKMVAQSRR